MEWRLLRVDNQLGDKIVTIPPDEGWVLWIRKEGNGEKAIPIK